MPEIESTSHENELEDDENELLFSDSEEEFEEDVAGSSSGLPNEEVNFWIYLFSISDNCVSWNVLCLN